MAKETPCDGCDKQCDMHADQVAMNALQERRIEKLEVVVEAIPRMQARVNTLMSIIIASMVVLISISGFSFLQLVDFKKVYFEDRKDHQELHASQALEQEKRYVDLINKLGNRVSLLEQTLNLN